MKSFLSSLFRKEKQLDASRVLELFGHSVYHPEIDKAFKEFDAISPDKSKLAGYDSVRSEYSGIAFTFWYKQFYERNINKPKSIFKAKDEEEVVLYEMTFKSGTNGNYLLPYGINLGDTSDVVISKLGQKPFSKSKNYDGDNTWMFYNDDFKIMPVFDDNLRLLWLRIWAIDINDKRKIQFQSELKIQNKNINQDNIEELISLKNSKPTIDWTIRMKGGDDIFTQKNIKESETILNDFIDELVIAVKSKKASSVYSKVKKVVSNFNKLNGGENSFIETMEREELVDFIEKATKLTGFKIEDGIDITEDWRAW